MNYQQEAQQTRSEGKLEEGHDVQNVQVIVNESTTVQVMLSLVDEEGVFLSVDPFQREAKGSSESDELLEKLAESEQKGEELQLMLELE